MTPKALSLQNTLGGRKEAFRPHEAGKVRIYCCGPTVYGYTHVGNARAALSLDLVARIFEKAGYEVAVARNFTDVDDKIIEAAHRESLSPEELAKKYERAYVEELSILDCKPPQFTPRATETMPEIIALIEKLLAKDFAYVAKTEIGQDVYFRVLKFQHYGKLSHRHLDDMLAGARIEIGEAKEHAGDFALWKAAKEGEPSWASPWGAGRPGWHIECSAMIQKHFGTKLDIHMGGVDLVFPHHENEIAQSEGAHSCELARYWLHNGLIEMGKEKMSKSLGNIVKTREFLDSFGPEVLRVLAYSHHYRSPIDFSSENVLRAEDLLVRLYSAKEKVESLLKSETTSELPSELKDLSSKIEEALFDDFNSARAFGHIMGSLRLCHRENRDEYWRAWAQSIPYLQSVYGILSGESGSSLKGLRDRKLKRSGISEARALEIEAQLIERQRLRKERQFSEADALRLKLEKEGVVVMDTTEGSTWSIKE